jgi:dynein heavy chain
MKKRFGGGAPVDDIFIVPLIFGDYLRGEIEDAEKVCEEPTNSEKVRKILEDWLKEYYFAWRTHSDPILFFNATIQPVSRILRQPRGHMVLVGVAGTEKRTLARFASFVSDCELAEIEVTDRHNLGNFWSDLHSSCMKSRSSGGSGGKRIALILSDHSS